MPSLQESPDIESTANGTANGVNGHSTDRPETPTGSMALTEYTINTVTPSAQKRAHIKKVVPEDYLLPSGYPDVR